MFMWPLDPTVVELEEASKVRKAHYPRLGPSVCAARPSLPRMEHRRAQGTPSNTQVSHGHPLAQRPDCLGLLALTN